MAKWNRQYWLAAILAVVIDGNAILGAPTPDWPQWRGRTRDVISPDTGLLKDWPAAGPKLLWKATDLGKSYASVVMSGERIYTCGDKVSDSFVIALKRAEGTPVWSTKLGKG